LKNGFLKIQLKVDLAQLNLLKTECFFEQIRIPLFDVTGKATDTRGWAKGLQKILKEKYQITAKLTMKGLGQAAIVVGEK